MKKLLILSFLMILILGCVGMQNSNQRNAQLMKECKQLMNMQRDVVQVRMVEIGFDTTIKDEVLSDSSEVLMLERTLTKSKNRYFDRVFLVFRDGVLQEYEINVTD